MSLLRLLKRRPTQSARSIDTRSSFLSTHFALTVAFAQFVSVDSLSQILPLPPLFPELSANYVFSLLLSFLAFDSQ